MKSRKVLGILLTLALLIGLLPQAAFADTVTYGLWVGETEVNSENKDDILGDGTASYDPDTNTLTLDNPTVRGTHEDAQIYYEQPKNSGKTLKITGSATLKNSDSTFGICIYVSGASVELDGKFDVSGGLDSIYAENDITITGGEVKATSNGGDYYPVIYASGNITINGGKVNAAGQGIGIGTEGNITINGGEVTATGELYGIKTSDGDITITGGKVNATSSGDLSDGIYAENDITITGGEVTATGVLTGISNNDSITISGGKVTATGDDFTGICASGNIIITDGEVTATGELYGIKTSDGDITIKNGVIGVTADGYAAIAAEVDSSITIGDKLKITEPVDGKIGEGYDIVSDYTYIAVLNSDGKLAAHAVVTPITGDDDQVDTGDDNAPEVGNTDTPKTGDAGYTALLIAITAVALIGMIGAAAFGKKRRAHK